MFHFPMLSRFGVKNLFLLVMLSIVLVDGESKRDYFFVPKARKNWADFRDQNLVKQQEDFTCGSASLATILTYYYGLQTSEKEVLDFVTRKKGIDLSKIDPANVEAMKSLQEHGLSFLDLAEFAENQGLEAIGLALDFHSLKQLKVPVIIFLNIRKTEHFSVYRGMDEFYVYLADPSFGNIKIPIKKFQEAFYQRSDLGYPGKILAILSKTTQGNQDFLKISTPHYLPKEIAIRKSFDFAGLPKLRD